MINDTKETAEMFAFEIDEDSEEINFGEILQKARIKWNDPNIQIHDLKIKHHAEDLTRCGCCESNYEYHLLITLRKNEPKKALTLRGE